MPTLQPVFDFLFQFWAFFTIFNLHFQARVWVFWIIQQRLHDGISITDHRTCSGEQFKEKTQQIVVKFVKSSWSSYIIIQVFQK